MSESIQTGRCIGAAFARTAVLLALFVAAIVGLQPPARADEPRGAPLTETVPDDAWDAVFNRSEGWIGGDAIYATPLPQGDVLWLFADTIIGNVRDGRRQPGLQMVNNTIARHALPRAGAAPDPRSVKFLWGSPPDAEKANSWIVPDTALTPGDEAAKDWYWVGDAVVAPGAQGQDRLIVFLWRTASTGKNDVFAFRTAGNALAIIDRPADDATTWRPRQVLVTHAVSVPDRDAETRPEVVWGSEVFVVDGADSEPHIFIYGYRQLSKTALEMVLARAPAAAIEDMNRWQFRTADGWSAKLDDAAALADRLTTEFSVTKLNADGAESVWVLVQSEPALGERILARTARSPYGPWSAPQPVYQVPGVDHAKRHFTYSGKAHAELSRPGELLVSYVVNSFDFGEGVTNAGIYRPRFVRVPTSILPGPPGSAR